MFIKSTAKVFISFSLFFFIGQKNTFAQSKLCEIKYNEQGNINSLERKINIKGRNKIANEKDWFTCHKIGLEHDKNRNPILTKPIYACCKSI